ncbi:MAG: recombinase family protein, partial [Alphaproteobacteria bacterium]
MEAARAGKLDVVMAESLDRLSRDQEDIAAIHKRLAHAGVRLITLAEGEINELHVGLKGTMNALYLKDLAQKTRRGQRGSVEAGRIPGGNSYGYRMVRKVREDGTVTRGEREIDEQEAAIVRRIFNEYARGIAPRKIAERLNREGVPSPRGGLWNASTINGSRQRRNGILNNELYVGRITYNRQRFIKDPDTGKRVSRLNPEHEWVVKDAPELRIIDQETWDAVQAIKAHYASHHGNKRQTKKRLLSGLVKCGACGGAMTIVNRERYYCSAKRERGTCSSSAGIRAADLEDRVLGGLRDILLDRDDLIDAFAEEYRRELERLRQSRGSRQRSLQEELGRVNSAISRCLAFITGGDGDPGLVRDELARLEIRKTELERELKDDSAPTIITPHPNTPDLFRRKVSDLQSLLKEEAARPEAMEIIRGLIDHIEVHESDTRGRPGVILVGVLASILAFAWDERYGRKGPQTQTAASGKGDGGRVLMVAGAGFTASPLCGLRCLRRCDASAAAEHRFIH